MTDILLCSLNDMIYKTSEDNKIWKEFRLNEKESIKLNNKYIDIIKGSGGISGVIDGTFIIHGTIKINSELIISKNSIIEVYGNLRLHYNKTIITHTNINIFENGRFENYGSFQLIIP